MRGGARCLVLLLLAGVQQLAWCQEEGSAAADASAEPTEDASSGVNAEAEAAAAAEEREARKKKGEGLSFCGFDNCFELLGVTRKSGPIPIKRAYRKLAAEYHPDKCPSGNIAMCREEFPKYANAYEILSSSDMRKTYEFVLDNPYDFPAFYMKFHSFKYAPKSDLRTVVIFSILFLSGMQFLFKKSQYEQQFTALKKFSGTRYNERVNEMIAKGAAKKGSTKTKGTGPKGEELDKRRKEAEAALDQELAAELPLAPRWTDTVAVELFKFPLTTIQTLQWYAAGGAREPEYMTRRALGISIADWQTYSEEEVSELVEKELWVGKNLTAYNAEMAERDRTPLKNRSAKEKRAVRQRKHNPVNQASVMQD
jgi:curved DNA-binding protein CbpA